MTGQDNNFSQSQNDGLPVGGGAENLSGQEQERGGFSLPPILRSKKVVLGVLGVLFLLGATVAAVYLVQRRQQVAPKATAGKSGDGGCLPGKTVATDAGPYSFAAAGVGLKGKNEDNIIVGLPAGASPLSDYVYLYWSGEKKIAAGQSIGKVVVNGTPLRGEQVYLKENSDWNNRGYIFRAKLPQSLVASSSLKFKVNGFDLPVGSDSDGGLHGAGVIVPYRQDGLPDSRVVISACGDFVYHGKSGPDNYSEPFNFDLSGAEPGSSLKAVFFFGEGEGEVANRPNYLFYGSTKLNLTDSTPYPAYSTDNGFWWDTRITGDDLPAISVQGASASFKTLSPQKGHGDSFYFIGGAVQYLAAGPTPTPTPTGTVTPTMTPTPTVTPTSTPIPTSTPQPTSTPTPTSTPQPTSTPAPTSTPGPTQTPVPTATPAPLAQATPTPSAIPVVGFSAPTSLGIGLGTILTLSALLLLL